MKETWNLCLGCMKELTSEGACTRCGFDPTYYQGGAVHALPLKTILKGRYLVGRLLSEEHQTYVYMACDLKLRIPVLVKEYFPIYCADRDDPPGIALKIRKGSEKNFSDGYQKFLKKAADLSRLGQEEEIPHALNLFQENGTVYLVTEYREESGAAPSRNRTESAEQPPRNRTEPAEQPPWNRIDEFSQKDQNSGTQNTIETIFPIHPETEEGGTDSSQNQKKKKFVLHHQTGKKWIPALAAAVVLCAVILYINPFGSRYVKFADANMEKLIRNGLEKPEGPITKEELAKIQVLRIVGNYVVIGYDAEQDQRQSIMLTEELGETEKITSLQDIRWFTGLRTLQVNGHAVSLDLQKNGEKNPLIGLPHLTTLELAMDNVSDIGALSDLTTLRALYLWEDEISDLAPLSSLEDLTELHMYQNQISDLTPLSGLSDLAVIDLGANDISDISPLSGLTKLHELGLIFNKIEDISALSGLTQLESLFLSANNIQDVTPLSGLTDLTTLYLDDNQIQDISPLEDVIPNLAYYNISGNPAASQSQ